MFAMVYFWSNCYLKVIIPTVKVDIEESKFMV